MGHSEGVEHVPDDNINIPSAFENTNIESAFENTIIRGAFWKTNTDVVKGTSFIIFSKALGILIFS